MYRLQPSRRHYAWGSEWAIPELLSEPSDGRPWAEAWFGAHTDSPATVQTAQGPLGLDALVETRQAETLGQDVVARFGARLPYLLKLIAPARPLSLQVHPDVERARAGYAAEEAAGVPRDAPERNYRDANHKPELVYALTPFEALCGFRAPRRSVELLDQLDAPLARRLVELLRSDPGPAGVRAAFAHLFDTRRGPGPQRIAELVRACAARLAAGSTSPRVDRIVVELARAYPGDPGVVAPLLLNPVSLRPGESMFVPAGGVHAYLSGTAVEVMASSDNVLRAGLTAKHVDVAELMECVDYVAAPPVRIAPEIFHEATEVFYAPVDDFELSVTTLDDDADHPLPGRGPRILLCLSGRIRAAAGIEAMVLTKGQAAFVPAAQGPLHVTGSGRLIQADVP